MTIEIPSVELNRIAQGFAKLLNEPSERSAIIVLGAQIESLTEKVCARLLPGVPLRFQRRQLNALKGFGALDSAVHQVLCDLADVRNHYAHSDDDCSLGDEKIKTKVKSIVAFGNDIFDSTSKLQTMRERLAAQLAVAGREAPPEWFNSELHHLFFVSLGLVTHLLALANLKVPQMIKLGVNDFTIKSVSSNQRILPERPVGENAS